MDDFGGLILGLVFGVLLIVALIHLFVYVVIPGAILYFFGRQFYRQINSYKLVNKTKTVLVLIGLLSLITSAVFVIVNEIPAIVIAPVSAVLFLTTSVTTLALWAYLKKRPYIETLASLYRRQLTQECERKIIAHKLEHLKNKNKTFKEEHGVILQEHKKLEGFMQELCGNDTRTYTIKKREWENQYKSVNNEVLALQGKKLAFTLRRANNNTEHEKIENSIKLTLLKLETIRRTIGKPLSEITDNELKIRNFEKSHNATQTELQNTTAEILAKKRAFNSFTSAGIVLD
jgi:ABC-type transport system involved in multi-copper enzyme maturation permease subunit